MQDAVVLVVQKLRKCQLLCLSRVHTYQLHTSVRCQHECKTWTWLKNVRMVQFKCEKKISSTKNILNVLSHYKHIIIE
jgi:hypothetical protein